MINQFIKFKMKNIKNKTFSKDDIKNSKKILFSLFTRYGDTIIDLVVIKEFIEIYNDKYYLILCPKQMVPYVNLLLPNVKVIGFNKRNIIDFVRVNLMLKKEKYDLGLNPWSNGIDSSYWISFCKNYSYYKDFKKPKIINHYNIIRKYLMLEEKNWQNKNYNLSSDYQNILICPESTDEERSISPSELSRLIDILSTKYVNSNIVIASLDEIYNISNIKYFKFQKSSASSISFIDLINKSDFIIAVDSGPLHIITALNKDAIGIFNVTECENVINSGSKIKVVTKKDLNENIING